jgi:hypothetical protein
MRAIGLAWLVISLAGCFTADVKSGAIHCSSDSTRLCPKSFTCVNDFCVANSSIDGGAPEDGFLAGVD